jgi:flagellar basal-body rod protein FlgF
MIRGSYAATAGMMAMLSRTQTIANNLANVNTPGYREDTLRVTTFPQQLMSRLFAGGGMRSVGINAMGMVNESIATRFMQGSFRGTENPLDVAINGDGFFAVQTTQGVRYTRDGGFRRDGNNQLVTAQGDLVLGANGVPITLPPGDVSILPTGEIRVAPLTGGQAGTADLPAGQLGIFTFVEVGQLRKVGGNLFEDPLGQAQPSPAGNSTMHQGYLENSNVDPARAMADLMVAQRTYEAATRMVQLQDEMTARAVSDVGRI